MPASAAEAVNTSVYDASARSVNAGSKESRVAVCKGRATRSRLTAEPSATKPLKPSSMKTATPSARKSRPRDQAPHAGQRAASVGMMSPHSVHGMAHLRRLSTPCRDLTYVPGVMGARVEVSVSSWRGTHSGSVDHPMRQPGRGAAQGQPESEPAQRLTGDHRRPGGIDQAFRPQSGDREKRPPQCGAGDDK